MNVNNWGPPGWLFLHCITFNYPEIPSESDKLRYKNFFENISDILPCKYCRDSYKIFIKYHPIDCFLDSRVGVCYWLFRIHNLVNKKLNCNNDKFIDVVKKYESFRAKCSKSSCNIKIDSNKEIYNEFISKSNFYQRIFDKNKITIKKYIISYQINNVRII